MSTFTRLAIHQISRTFPLAYGFLLLILALFKGHEFWKLHGHSGSRLVLVLIKDQAFYYILYVPSLNYWALIIILYRVTLCSVFLIMDDRFKNASAIFQSLGSPTLLCVFGSRMFFNLKEAAEHGVNVGTNWSSYSHSAICFGDGKAHPQLVNLLHVPQTHQLTKRMCSTGTMSALCSLSNPIH